MGIKNTQTGFTFIELLIAVSVLTLLTASILATIAITQKNSRDAERIGAIRQIQVALEIYFIRNGVYPDGDTDGTGGWDTPGDGDFISELTQYDPLLAQFGDPVLDTAGGNFRYHRFPAGSFGCPIEQGAFYVLGIGDMETSRGDHPLSPAWVCPERNFQNEMEFVVGKFER